MVRSCAVTGPSSCSRAQTPMATRPESSAAESGLRGVEGVQARHQLGVEAPQHDLIEPPVGGGRRLGAVTTLPEELLGRAIPDQLGEALVEWRGALHVQRVVRNLVKHQRRQLHGIAREGR